jgi:dTDP-4-amino-4,6-dideoxygalactose transaminase
MEIPPAAAGRRREAFPMLECYTTEPAHSMLRDQILTAVARVLDSNRLVLGEEVAAFEREYAAYCGTSECIGVGSGTDALYLALRALEIGLGDEVIVPAQTFVATALAVTRTGATPRFADIDCHHWTLDVESARQAVTERTRALIAVHLYGLPCDMDPLLNLAAAHRLALIEDNAQATGATFRDCRTGSLGVLAAHSFYPTKNLGCCGDGGAITTDRANLADRIRRLRNYGFAKPSWSVEPGINSRLDEIQAAILRVKLPHVDDWNRERRALSTIYREQLTGVGDVQVQATRPEAIEAPHLFVITSQRRSMLEAHLAQHGIRPLRHYSSTVPAQPAFHDAGSYPHAEWLARSCLSLPLYPGLKPHDVKQVCEVIRQFYGTAMLSRDR